MSEDRRPPGPGFDLTADLLMDGAPAAPPPVHPRVQEEPEVVIEAIEDADIIEDADTAPDPQPAPEIGYAGHYELVARYPGSDMTEVYLAHKTSRFGFVRTAVVKRANPSRPDFETYREMLLDEALAIAWLDHENIVAILDVGEDETGFFVAMEHVGGTDLRRVNRLLRRRGEALPFELAGYIAEAVLRGLHAAHTAHDRDGAPLHIVHRDVNPSNVLISTSGHVKLTDFGVVKMRDRLQGKTKPGIVKGKYAYLAPEYILGKACDFHVDIYGVGVMLFEMLTGRPCFSGLSAHDVMRKIVREELPLERLPREGVPRELEAIVVRATHGNPARRFASAEEMANALETWIMRSGQHATPWILSAFFRQHRLFEAAATPAPVPKNRAPHEEPVTARGRAEDALEAAKPAPAPAPAPQASLRSISAMTPPRPMKLAAAPAPDPARALLSATAGLGPPEESPPPKPPPLPEPAPSLAAEIVAASASSIAPTARAVSKPPPIPPTMPDTIPTTVMPPAIPHGALPPLDAEPESVEVAPVPTVTEVETVPMAAAPEDDEADDDTPLVSPVALDAIDDDDDDDDDDGRAPVMDPSAMPLIAREVLPPTDVQPLPASAFGPALADQRPWSGALEDHSPGQVLVELTKRRATGTVELRNGPIWKKLTLIDGRPAELSSNVGMEDLGDQILRAKLLSRDELDRVQRELGGNVPLLSRLLQRGIVDERALAGQLGRTIENAISEVLDWRTGRFDFTPGEPPAPELMPDLDLATYVHVRRPATLPPKGTGPSVPPPPAISDPPPAGKPSLTEALKMARKMARAGGKGRVDAVNRDE